MTLNYNQHQLHGTTERIFLPPITAMCNIFSSCFLLFNSPHSTRRFHLQLLLFTLKHPFVCLFFSNSLARILELVVKRRRLIFLDRKIGKDKFDIQRQNRQGQIFRELGKLYDPFYNHGQKSWDKFALVDLFHSLNYQSRANAISLVQPLPTSQNVQHVC